MKKVRFEKEMVTPKYIYFVEGTNSNLSDYLANLIILKLDEVNLKLYSMVTLIIIILNDVMSVTLRNSNKMCDNIFETLNIIIWSP